MIAWSGHIVSLLKKPYPFQSELKSNYVFHIGLAAAVCLILWIFQPFDLHKIPGNQIYKGLGFDGTNLWGAAKVSGQIRVYKFAISGAAIDSFVCPGMWVCGLACTDGRVWLRPGMPAGAPFTNFAIRAPSFLVLRWRALRAAV